MISSKLNLLKTSSLEQLCAHLISRFPRPTLRNLWLTLSCLVIIQNLVVFTNTQITGNAITALIVWGGAIICMEDHIETLRPKPSSFSLSLGIFLVFYSLFRTSRVISSDSFLYVVVPVAGLGLLLMAEPVRSIRNYKDPLLVLCLLPLFVVIQIFASTYASVLLSELTARFVLMWLNLLGIEPVRLLADTVYVRGGAIQVMHECNGFEMIMQMLITAIIFLLAFPLRSRLAKVSIILLAPLMGFFINSIRISLLAIFTSLDSDLGKSLFDFFHEQAGSLIFSGIAVFLLGYLYLKFLDRELPPLHET